MNPAALEQVRAWRVELAKAPAARRLDAFRKAVVEADEAEVAAVVAAVRGYAETLAGADLGEIRALMDQEIAAPPAIAPIVPPDLTRARAEVARLVQGDADRRARGDRAAAAFAQFDQLTELCKARAAELAELEGRPDAATMPGAD